MVRIGIVGTESSHAKGFLKFKEYMPEDVVITSVLEDGDGTGESLAKEIGIPYVVYAIQEMLIYVDAVMIFYRSVGKHYKFAKFLLNEGKSVWLDKPFTETVYQARELFVLAKEKGLTIDGGSTLRFCADVQKFSALIQKEEHLFSGNFNYPGMTESPYGGLMFYGPHSLTLLVKLFGTDVISLFAMKHNKELLLSVRYEQFVVSVHIVDEFEHVYGEIYTPQDIIRKQFNFVDIYRKGLLHFCELLNKRECGEYELLVLPVALLRAVYRSLESGKEELIEPWK